MALRDVVDVLVWPMIELGGARRGGGGYVGFLAAVMNHPEYIPLMNQLYEPDIYHARAPGAGDPPPVLGRPDAAMGHRQGHRQPGGERGDEPGPPVAQALRAPHAGDSLGERLVDFLTGAFAAEARGPRLQFTQTFV